MRKNNRKIFILLFVIIAMIGSIHIGLANVPCIIPPSPGSLIYYIDSAEANFADEVVLQVYVASNGYDGGYAGFSLELEYDSEKIKPLYIKENDIIHDITSDIGKNHNGVIKMIWAQPKNFYYEGAMFSVGFKIYDKATFDETILILKGRFIDENKNEIRSVYYPSGGIIYLINKYEMNAVDINLDGKVDIVDLLMMKQLLQGYKLQLSIGQLRSCDLNKNNGIDAGDFKILADYLVN